VISTDVFYGLGENWFVVSSGDDGLHEAGCLVKTEGPKDSPTIGELVFGGELDGGSEADPGEDGGNFLDDAVDGVGVEPFGLKLALHLAEDGFDAPAGGVQLDDFFAIELCGR